MSAVEGATTKDSFNADRYDVPVSKPPVDATAPAPGAVFFVASVLRLALEATLRSPSPEVKASTALVWLFWELVAAACCCC